LETRIVYKAPDLPCQIYFDWRDPSVSEEDHAKGVQERVKQLKSMLEEKHAGGETLQGDVTVKA